MTTTTISIKGTDVDVYDETGEEHVLPDLSGDDWCDLAKDSWENGMYGCYQFVLADGVSLYVDTDQGYPLNATIRTDTPAEHISGWDHGDDCDLAQWMSGWGFNAMNYLEEAPEDYDGECRVWVVNRYYPSTCGAPQDDYWRDDDGEILTYSMGREAHAAVAAFYDADSAYDGIKACNVLSHGQAAAPRLKVVKA